MDQLRVAFANLKPGTSKTTSSIFLATAFHLMGLRTLLVDSDPGRSATRWQEISGERFAFDLTTNASKNLYHQLRPLAERGGHDVVIVDCPQLEDHSVIGRGALRFADHWVVPVAPSGPEMDRSRDVASRILDEVDATRDVPGRRYCLITRTNRHQRTKGGADAVAARQFDKQGYDVIPHNVIQSDWYRVTQYGVGTPDLTGTPFPMIAEYLIERHTR